MTYTAGRLLSRHTAPVREDAEDGMIQVRFEASLAVEDPDIILITATGYRRPHGGNDFERVMEMFRWDLDVRDVLRERGRSE